MTGAPHLSLFESASTNLDPALDIMPYAVFTRNSDYSVRLHNKTFSKIFPAVSNADNPRDAYNGTPCYRIIFGDGKKTPCANCLIAHAISSGKEITREIHVTRDTGSRFYRLTAVPLKNDDGTVIDAYEFIEDITARAMAEEKINQYSSHLELVTSHSVSMLRKNEEELTMMA
ncbi:MAG TPA: PAS domain-containing protein, partial [Spirochaetota bacterium]|nr:PAS domain-containing protein [Spirochaetota bacterium]